MNVKLAASRSLGAVDVGVLDGGVAVLLAAVAQLDLWLLGNIPGPRAALVPLLLVATLALAWRRRAPLAVLVVVGLAVAGQAQLAAPAESFALLFPVMVALYTVAARCELRLALLGAAVAGFAELTRGLRHQDPVSDWMFVFFFFTAAWLVGRAVHHPRAQARALQERTAHLERDREERARAAVAEERTRIARELHDIVAHSVSVMVVQAGSGRRVVERDPAGAHEAFVAVEASGRQALGDLRRLLGVLRADGERRGASLRSRVWSSSMCWWARCARQACQ